MDRIPLHPCKGYSLKMLLNLLPESSPLSHVTWVFIHDKLGRQRKELCSATHSPISCLQVWLALPASVLEINMKFS
ncbi:rCG45256 [Rattus norvegicus]|uniref:RCG45256 n=1 Tax=Rattus norvegicus TaxID=10116 RepID=A6KLH1_RAT|nr:rCG45256 [Rattus norvegicus]